MILGKKIGSERNLAEYYCKNIVCCLGCYICLMIMHDLRAHESQAGMEQVPTVPPPWTVKFFFSLCYYIEPIILCAVFPFVAFSMTVVTVLTLLLRKLNARLQSRKTCYAMKTFYFEFLLDTTPQAIVKELKQYRSRCFEKGDFNHDVILTPQTSVYYKKVQVEDLSQVEAENWSDLCHVNLTRLYKFKEFGRQETIYIAEVSTWRYILNDILFNEEFNDRPNFFGYAIKWSHDVLMGLEYLHSRNLYHLDLEAENILIDFDKSFNPLQSKAIVGNFEHMQKVNDPLKSVSESDVGFTDFYRPPEAYMLKKIDAEKCDMWGLGIIILELFTGGILRLWHSQFKVFSHKRRDQVLTRMLIFANFCSATEAAHKSFADLRKGDKWKDVVNGESSELTETAFWQIWVFITDLLRMDSYTRINVKQGIHHGFVDNVYKLLYEDNNESEDSDEIHPEVVFGRAPVLESGVKCEYV